MAVVITTKFYEEDTPAWHDLAKVVFTSPNMDSPNTAGTRSHILPGQADLGIWYEDDSYMYRAEFKQDLLPVEGECQNYIGTLDLYFPAEFSFVADSSVLIDYGSFDYVNLNEGDTIYYNKDNYGTVVSTVTITSGILVVEDETITVYDGFSENRRAGYSYNVYWETTGIYLDEFVNIYYSTNGGIAWNVVELDVSNDGSHIFTIPDVTGLAKLKVESSSNPVVKDESFLFVTNTGDLNVITPTSGTLWSGRTTHKLWWNCTDFFQEELIGVDISFNNGSTWDTVVSGVLNSGNTVINLPVGNSTYTKIKVYSMDNQSTTYTDSPEFTTSATSSEILSPEFAEMLNNYRSYKLWWNSNEFYNDENVDISMSYDNGESWNVLSSGILNTGYATVDLSLDKSGDYCRLKVVATDFPDSVYAINEVTVYSGTSIDIIHPFDFDILGNDATHRVWWNSDNFTWTNSDSYERVNYYHPTHGAISYVVGLVTMPNNLYDGNSNTYANFSENTLSLGVDNYSLQIIMNEDFVAEHVKAVSTNGVVLRVSVYATNSTFSEGNYTILDENLLVYDGSAVSLSNNNISYYKYRFCIDNTVPDESFLLSKLELGGHVGDDVVRNRVDVLLSTDSGGSWDTLASGIVNTGYADVVLEDSFGTSVESLLMVRDYHNPSHLIDTNTIAVISGSLDLKWPNSVDSVFIVGDYLYAWWNSNYVYNSNITKIELSTNSGIDYTSVKTVNPNTGYTSFILDSVPTSIASIKVSKEGSPGVYDDSDIMFTIEDPYIDILSVTSGTVIRRPFIVNSPLTPYSSTQYIPAYNIDIYYNTNIYADSDNFSVYKSYNGGDSFTLVTSSSNNGRFANVLKDLDTLTDQAVIKLSYVNDAGTTVSGVSESFNVADPFTKVSDALQVIPMDYWSSSYRYGNYIYRISGYDNKIYRFDVDTNGCEFVVAFTESVISKPYLTIKNGIYYIVNQESLSFYSYNEVSGLWSVLSQLPDTPKCLKSTTDADNYIYTLAGLNWYKYNIVSAGSWEFIRKATENMEDASFPASSIWKGDVVTVSGTSGSTTYFCDFRGSSSNQYIVYSDLDNNVVFSGLGEADTVHDESISTSIAQSGNKVMAVGSVYRFDLAYLTEVDPDTKTIMVADVSVSGTIMTETEDIIAVEDELVLAFGSDVGNMDVVEYKDDKWIIYIDADGESVYDASVISTEPIYAYYTEQALIFDYSGNRSYINKEISIRGLSSNAVYYDNAIYINGGAYSTAPYYKYDLLNDEYSFPSTALISNNRFDVLCVDGTFLYKLTGKESNIFYKCNLSTDVITELENIPAILGETASMCYHAANNKIYVSVDKDSISSLWVYDISGDSWTVTETLPYVMDSALVVSGGDFVYVLESEAEKYRLVRYDPTSNTWVALTGRDLFGEHSWVTYAGYVDGAIYCYYFLKLGGDSLGVYKYDITMDEWSIFLHYLYTVEMDSNFTKYSKFNVDGGHWITGAVSPDYFYTLVNSKVVYDPDTFTPYYGTIQPNRSGIFKSDIAIDYTFTGDISNWIVPTNRVQKTQPDGWTEPPYISYLQSSPGGWTAPVEHPELSTAPIGWVAPIESNLESEPVNWDSPISVDDREPESPDLTPIASGPSTAQDPYAVNIELSDVNGSEVIKGVDGDSLYVWTDDVGSQKGDSWAGIDNCVVFELTVGENYDCRLTAWDDTTHSTTLNELLLRDICRVYAVAFSSTKTISEVDASGFTLHEFVYGPVENKILNGNISYYGDFDMKYRAQTGIYGDYLMFRPLLYGIDETFPYGIHDHVITFHYSYT